MKLKATRKMKIRVYKLTIVALTVCLLAGTMCFAQVEPVQPVQPAQPAQPVQVPQPVQVAAPVSVTITTGNGQIVTASVKADKKALMAQLRELKADVKGIIAAANSQMIAAINEAAVKVDVDGAAPLVSAKTDNTASSTDKQNGAVFKNYSKVYPADAGDKLVIDNRYGKIVVNTWDKDSFKVDVQIKASAHDDSQAQDILDDVSIADAKDGSSVAFRTDIDEGKSIWKTIFGGGDWSSHSLEVDYTVYMPAKNELVIRNRYGAVFLPNLGGKVTVDCAYGSFHAGSLSGESAIRVKYGNADIDNLGTSALDLSDGNLTLRSVGKIEANVTYSGIKIGKLRETGAFNIRYGGGLKIEDLDKNVSSLAINSTYSSVNIGLSGDENANFAVTVHYGDFNYNARSITFTDKSPGDNDHGPNFTKSYKGVLGKGNPDKNIAINTSYGSVQFD